MNDSLAGKRQNCPGGEEALSRRWLSLHGHLGFQRARLLSQTSGGRQSQVTPTVQVLSTHCAPGLEMQR